MGGFEENGKVRVEEGAGKQSGDQNSSKRLVCPKLFISLSSKEKEDDFMAMKGCKLPQRPKKRAKVIQRTLLVSLLLLLFPTDGGRPFFLSFLI